MSRVLDKLLLRRPTPPGAIPLDRIAEHLPDSPVVVEAGAHRGTDTVDMALQWPGGHIHAFEPVEPLYRTLRAAVRDHPNAQAWPYAVSDREGPATMCVSSGNDQSSSLLTPTHKGLPPETRFEAEQQVETVTLDRWAERENVDAVDFLWLDMQGSELAALKGAERLLSTVTAVYTEVVLYEQYEGECLYPELRVWLERRGFRVEAEKLPWDVGGNVLFVR